jgi:hypothetical protein
MGGKDGCCSVIQGRKERKRPLSETLADKRGGHRTQGNEGERRSERGGAVGRMERRKRGVEFCTNEKYRKYRGEKTGGDSDKITCRVNVLT